MMRMSQIILQKHYTKMKREQIVSISIGKVVQKNAPIKYAEIVEGLSDVEIEEESDELISNDKEDSNIQVNENGSEVANNSRVMHDSNHKLNVSHATETSPQEGKEERKDKSTAPSPID